MNLVDSCGWLEYFAAGPNADFFAQPLGDSKRLLVPTICILEVAKALMRQRGEDEAALAVAAMKQGQVVDLNLDLALAAAKLSLTHKLPLADAVILATARSHEALIWTQDSDFEGLPGVRYQPAP